MNTQQKTTEDFYMSLFGDLNTTDNWPAKQPLLAHYTSFATLERILATDEVWFSNPLFMNDLEELRFGIFEGIQQFFTNVKVKDACRTKERFELLANAFNHYSNVFNNEHALDVYVFCTVEHDESNPDGQLSMWRGYGGNGNGAAIVIDTKQFGVQPDSPLVVSRVEYLSTEERRQWISKKLEQFANLLTNLNPPDDQLFIPASFIFERIKLFALFTKHRGFIEEREWRIVFLKDRDKKKLLEPMFDYAIGPRGMEPKLKFKVQPIEGLTTDDLSLSKIIKQIILGPMMSSPLAKSTVLRMLEKLKKPELRDRVTSSTIPFRVV